MANIAYVEGYSPAGVKDESSDPATVECIGAPAIRVLKEVSDNGINWQPVTLTTFAPSDAHYRITVTNVGNVALENVMVNDSLLGIVDYIPIGVDGAGMLGIGESIVIDEGDLAELYWPTICTGTDEIPNTVFVDGKATDSTVTVDDDDSVTLICQEQINICAEAGKPASLKFVYTGTPESDHHQYIDGVAVAWANPDDAVLPAVATIELYDKENVPPGTLVHTYHNVAIGDHVTILGDWGPGGLLLPNIRFEILDGDGVVKQSIFLHGSCSAPLYLGDKHGALTIIGYTRK
jgi:uncharacterized repeat protein (TIGR01451 family)